MAGLKEAISGGVDQAFSILAEFVEDLEFEGLGGAAVYDAISGTVSQRPSTVSAKGIFTENKHMDGEVIRVGDRTLLVRTSEIAEIPAKCRVKRANGENWNVINSETDPSRTVITCQVRRGT